MKRKAGFTLLELLVTAVIFVIVAGLATAAFSSTAHFQFVNKQSQNTAAQVQIVAKNMSDVIARSVASDVNHQPRFLASTQEVGQGGIANQVLAVFARKAQLDSSISDQTLDDEWNVYCVLPDTVTNVYRLVHFVAPSGAAINGGVSSIACDKTTLSTSLFGGATVTGPEYLTEQNVDINAFHAAPVTYNPAPVVDPPAIRLELVAQYDPTNTSGVEQRASDTLTNPSQLVIRTVAMRTVPAVNNDPNLINRNQ